MTGITALFGTILVSPLTGGQLGTIIAGAHLGTIGAETVIESIVAGIQAAAALTALAPAPGPELGRYFHVQFLSSSAGRPDFAQAILFDPEPAHVVGMGGAIGATLRYWVYLHVTWEDFPAATLLVNVLGSFAFALVLFGGAGETAVQLLGLGICGSFTTFSTFSVETVQLWERGDRSVAVANATINLLAALTAIGVAWLLIAAVS